MASYALGIFPRNSPSSPSALMQPSTSSALLRPLPPPPPSPGQQYPAARYRVGPTLHPHPPPLPSVASRKARCVANPGTWPPHTSCSSPLPYLRWRPAEHRSVGGGDDGAGRAPQGDNKRVVQQWQ